MTRPLRDALAVFAGICLAAAVFWLAEGIAHRGELVARIGGIF